MGNQPTSSQTACFEAGIKFGSLYHQFAGTPVSPESAESLECAIEESIENQPHCQAVGVDIDTDALADVLAESTASYTELTGQFLDVEIDIEYESQTVHAEMHLEDGYPMMRITSVEEHCES